MFRVYAALTITAFLAAVTLRGAVAQENKEPEPAPAPAPAESPSADAPDESRDDDAEERELVVEVPEGKQVKERYLGVVTVPVPEIVQAQVSDVLGEGEGLLVRRVLDDSPAAAAGIQRNDILTTFNGEKVRSPEELKRLITDSKAGGEVEIGILRTGKAQTLRATLGERTVWDRRPRFRFRHGHPRMNVHVDTPRFRARGIGREDGGVDVSVEPKEDAEADREADDDDDEGPTIRRFSLRELDGGRVQLDVQYTGRDGETKERSFVGTRREVRQQLRELPPRVGVPMRRFLFEAEPVPDARPPRFRLRIRPSLRRDGELGLSASSLEINVVRTGKDGETRVFNLDGWLAPHAPGGPRGNLDIKVLREELDELEPEVRVEVENALERLRVPEPRVDVETSQ